MRTYLSRVRRENNLSRPPINPREIADNYGLKIQEVEFEEQYANVAGFVDFAERAIYVNAKDPFNRQTFTIAHELGHFLMHEDIYKQDPSQYQVLLRMPIGAETDPLEKEANAFAAHLLVPRDALIDTYSFGSIDDLANYFVVSKDVIRARIEFEKDRLDRSVIANGRRSEA